MCRLAAFPPNFSRDEAIAALLQFEGHNKDGVGSAYVKNNQFVVNKFPVSLSGLLSSKKWGPTFLAHMPYNGWTIAHLRAATHGNNTYHNTHPFVVNEWAVVHNGIWHEHNIARMVLAKTVKFKGTTDSEVAAHCINVAGIDKFNEEADWAGVFLALNKDGHLWGIKNSGCLELCELENGKSLLGSTLFKYQKSYEITNGWFHFGPNGKFIESKPTKFQSNYVSQYQIEEVIDSGQFDEEDVREFIQDIERRERRKRKYHQGKISQLKDISVPVKTDLGPPIKDTSLPTFRPETVRGYHI